MPRENERVVTYPADMVGRVADRLQDMDWNMGREVAEDTAYEIVLDMTLAVDKLRASERSDG